MRPHSLGTIALGKDIYGLHPAIEEVTGLPFPFKLVEKIVHDVREFERLPQSDKDTYHRVIDMALDQEHETARAIVRRHLDGELGQVALIAEARACGLVA